MPAWAQIDQQEYWRQVDQQRYNEEQARWASDMADEARWHAAEAADDYDNSWRDSAPSMGPVDSMRTRWAQLSAMGGIAQQLIYDPQMDKMRKGFWEFHDIGGKYRSAMFINLNGFISLHGPGGGFDGSLLMLWGPNIPAPKTVTLVPTTLKQNQYPEKTVKAFNIGFPQTPGWGSLIFVVPSYKALVDNIEDDQTFTASMDGKVVFSSAWHSGKTAQAKLAE